MTKKYDNNIVYLPTAKEYDEEAAQKPAFELISRWSEPKYRCPKCGGGMCKDLTIVFLTHLEAMKEYRDIFESRNYLEKVW